MMEPKVLEGIRYALDQDPGNGPLWVHYSTLLARAGQKAEALEALRSALEAGQNELDFGAHLIRLLRENGQTTEALIRAEKLLEKRDDPATRLELAHVLLERNQAEEAQEHYARAVRANPLLKDGKMEQVFMEPIVFMDNEVDNDADDDVDSGTEDDSDLDIDAALAGIAPESMDLDEWAAQFDWDGLRVTFDDVAGLQEVKRQIDLRIIAPFKRPEIYRAFKRQGGGGIMLYGPPGCGKTYIAKATAGELDARFLTVSLHEVIDKYWGESEKMVHALFENARLQTPAVLFFDEFDALGSSRGKSNSQFFRTLVNQLLQEMDGLEGHNENLLLFAATNMPWTVDPAFRRPGRFDRVLFVPPPDVEARGQIIKTHTASVPGGDKIPVPRLAKETAMMTGADLKSLCEQAAEYALERSLESGKVENVTPADFKQALKRIKSSALEWLSTAKNYAKYSNEAGYYDDLAEFLRKSKRW